MASIYILKVRLSFADVLAAAVSSIFARMLEAVFYLSVAFKLL